MDDVNGATSGSLVKSFDTHLLYLEVAKRPFLIFAIVFFILLARLSFRVADPSPLYVLSAIIFLILVFGTYLRYVWYFKNSFIIIDDIRINWYRNGEDHLFAFQSVSSVKFPNRLGQYYGMSTFLLRFTSGPNFSLNVLVPSYDDIIAEIFLRMKGYPHLRGIVEQIGQEMS